MPPAQDAATTPAILSPGDSPSRWSPEFFSSRRSHRDVHPVRTPTLKTPALRFWTFVDFWNVQLTMNERLSRHSKDPDARFRFDWNRFIWWSVDRAATVLATRDYSFDGATVYTSYDSSTEGMKHRDWAESWLNRQPGISVQCRLRQLRSIPRCNNCHRQIRTCPHCAQRIGGTAEKGVDTAIATDMIRLAWEGAYDVAVLVSSDSDLVPAVQFLTGKGIKVIQAGFPPTGSHLAKASWASFDIFAGRAGFERS